MNLFVAVIRKLYLPLAILKESYAEMAAMIPPAWELNRQICRKYLENKFNDRQIVNGYEAIYRQIIKDRIESKGCICAPNIQF